MASCDAFSSAAENERIRFKELRGTKATTVKATTGPIASRAIRWRIVPRTSQYRQPAPKATSPPRDAVFKIRRTPQLAPPQAASWSALDLVESAAQMRNGNTVTKWQA